MFPSPFLQPFYGSLLAIGLFGFIVSFSSSTQETFLEAGSRFIILYVFNVLASLYLRTEGRNGYLMWSLGNHLILWGMPSLGKGDYEILRHIFTLYQHAFQGVIYGEIFCFLWYICFYPIFSLLVGDLILRYSGLSVEEFLEKLGRSRLSVNYNYQISSGRQDVYQLNRVYLNFT